MLTARKALELIESIPTEEFVTAFLTNYRDRCCVIGHLHRLTSNNPNNYLFNLNDFDITHIFRDKTSEFLKTLGYDYEFKNIASVNNLRYIKPYTQATPKERVVAFLTDMIKWEESHNE